MSTNETNGLLFAGDLLLSFKDPVTGIYSAYQKLACDKFEIKTPSDQVQKISKGRDNFGQAWLTHYTGKPVEFATTLDEVSRDIFAMQLSGVVSSLTQEVGALAGIDVTVVPGLWVDIGYENLDLTGLLVKNAAGTTTYVKDVDYQINPRLGMLLAVKGGPIVAGVVKLTAAKGAFTGSKIEGGKQYSHTMRAKLDGVNLITRQDLLLVCPQATVSSQDAFDFLSGKLASVPLKGMLEVPPSGEAPFTLKYFS